MRWRGMMEHLRFKYGPSFANRLVALSTYRARVALRKSGPISVLIDNTVLGYGVTHESGWISTGVKKWGPHDVATGYLARVPVHPVDSNSADYQNIQYLPGIAHLAREGFVRLKTSAELGAEQDRQPIGRFKGYGYFDYNVFSGLKMTSVDGYVLPQMGPAFLNLPTPAEQQRARLEGQNDPLYRSLLSRLGPGNSQDAWHIRTAEAHGLFCFLTMDFSLLRTLAAVKNQEPVRSLRTRVLMPLEFGRHFGLLPVAPHVLSYNDASFFVRSDLSMPGGKRRPLKSYRRA